MYYVFDLLYLDGFDLRGSDLIDRKRVLEALLDNTQGVQLVRYVDHIAGNGELVLEHACKLGLEGIVSRSACPLGATLAAERALVAGFRLRHIDGRPAVPSACGCRRLHARMFGAGR